MKKIELKKTKMLDDSNPPKVITYGDLLLNCLRSAFKTSYSIEEMKARFVLIELLTEIEEKDFLEVNEDQFEYLRRCVNEMNGHWPTIHRDIVDFVDYINIL